MQFEDPLNQQNLEVKDIASARYALKTANDYRYAVIHMREQMGKELGRSGLENWYQKVAILQQYIPRFDKEGKPTAFGLIVQQGGLPETLPKTVPQSAIEAMAELDAQWGAEQERAEAELSDNAAPLLELADYLESLVKVWAREQFNKKAAWIGGSNTFTLGGCAVTDVGNDITFSYTELDYE